VSIIGDLLHVATRGARHADVMRRKMDDVEHWLLVRVCVGACVCAEERRGGWGGGGGLDRCPGMCLGGRSVLRADGLQRHKHTSPCQLSPPLLHPHYAHTHHHHRNMHAQERHLPAELQWKVRQYFLEVWGPTSGGGCGATS
jgi:hypothetical protein